MVEVHEWGEHTSLLHVDATTFSIMTLSIMGLSVTVSIKDTQHNIIECYYAQCRYVEYLYADCHIFSCHADFLYAEWRYAECHYAECRGAGIYYCSKGSCSTWTVFTTLDNLLDLQIDL